jgi:hypothetical protein
LLVDRLCPWFFNSETSVVIVVVIYLPYRLNSTFSLPELLIGFFLHPSQPKCLRRYNLRFVTSSMQEKARTGSEEKQEDGTAKTESLDRESEAVKNVAPASKERGSGPRINPFGAYRVVSSAASFLHSRAVRIMPLGSRNDDVNDPTVMTFVNGENGEGLTMDEASLNSVTSMVAAKEETRQAVADDLNSSRSCPCEWFVCDDDQSSTRYFVVQVLIVPILICTNVFCYHVG